MLGASGLLAGLVILGASLRSYGHQVPLALGPYKQAALFGCAFIVLIAAGFYFRPLKKGTAWGTFLLLTAYGWFTLRTLIGFRHPGSPWLIRMDQFMPFPLAMAGMGLALWLDALLPKRIGDRSFPFGMETALALLLMFLVLQPVLSGSFCWDDAFFSVEAQSMRVTGESIFTRVWREIVEYVRIGRINPFATFHFLVFYFIPDPRAYKLLLVILTLLDGFLFYRFIRLWGKEHRPALLALIAVSLCFQFRFYHDPLNSYYGLMQVMFIELMTAMIWFIRWTRENRTHYLILSLAAFTMGLMSYEMFFPFTALFLILAWDEEEKLSGMIRRVLPYGILAAGLFALSMLLRTNITEETAYNGTTFSMDIPVILRTFFCQVTAAFPLSYRLAGYDAGLFGQLVPWNTLFNTSLSEFISRIRWEDLTGCLILALLILPCRELSGNRSRGKKILFALLLWLLPGTVISLSWKYQQELRPGLAYIPVFFSYFGAAQLISLAAEWIENKYTARAVRFLLWGAGCAMLLLTMQDNRHISAMLNDVFRYPREASEQALQAGILGESLDGETLVISANDYSLWEHGWMYEPLQSQFFSLNTRRPLRAEGARDFVNASDAEDDTTWLTPKNTLLYASRGSESGGFAKAGRIRGTCVDRETEKLTLTLVSDVYIYVSGTDMEGAVLFYENQDAEFKMVPLIDEAWLIRETDQGALYKLEENRPVLFDTIGLVHK